MFANYVIVAPDSAEDIGAFENKLKGREKSNTWIIINNEKSEIISDDLKNRYNIIHLNLKDNKDLRATLKRFISGKNQYSIDISFANPIISFYIGELSPLGNCEIIFRGNSLDYHKEKPINSRAFVGTKAKIVAYLEIHPNSSPKTITEGVFNDFSKYNLVLRNLNTLMKKNVVGRSRHLYYLL